MSFRPLRPVRILGSLTLVWLIAIAALGQATLTVLHTMGGNMGNTPLVESPSIRGATCMAALVMSSLRGFARSQRHSGCIRKSLWHNRVQPTFRYLRHGV